jgi:hypothetical protein
VKRLRLAGLSLAILLLAAQAQAAQAGSATAEKSGAPISALAVNGTRVAYASGGWIHVWNMATGATSVIRGKYSNGKHTVAAWQVAIAGKRVAWIKDQQFGNTEEGESLYTAQAGGAVHQLKHVYRYDVDASTQTTGGWIYGLVGAGKHLAVSTWKSKGTAATDAKLSLVTGKGLSPLAGGVGTIVSEAVDGGHIAVLSSSPWAASTSARVYSVAGKPLAKIPLGNASEIALTGNLLIVLTPAPTPTVKVYNWTTGTLEHTWPAVGATTKTSGPHQVGHVEAYGGLVLYSVYTGYVGNNERLHVLDPATGKDAVVSRVQGYGDLDAWAIGSRGLVYAIDSGKSGKLVFVPMSKLSALVG